MCRCHASCKPFPFDRNVFIFRHRGVRVGHRDVRVGRLLALFGCRKSRYRFRVTHCRLVGPGLRDIGLSKMGSLLAMEGGRDVRGRVWSEDRLPIRKLGWRGRCQILFGRSVVIKLTQPIINDIPSTRVRQSSPCSEDEQLQRCRRPQSLLPLSIRPWGSQVRCRGSHPRFAW
jgi:hypothetical protein